MEGVLNFHGEDTDYYEEWLEDISDGDGWVALLNCHGHVMDELTQTRLDNYLAFGEQFNDLAWRPQKPGRIFEAVEGLLETGTRRIY
jgi:hypothetical protein